MMKPYKNLAGNVGICSYELDKKKIRIKLHSHKEFIYDSQIAGEEHFDQMQRLATQGFGLNEYIKENNLEAIALD